MPAPRASKRRLAPDLTPDPQGNITVPVGLLEEQVGSNPIIDEIKQTGRALLNLRLNEREREFIIRNPVASIRGAFAAIGAFVTSAAALLGDPLTDSRKDAVRHALFAAQLFSTLDAETAQTILDNHEFGRNDPFDNENNAVGRAIGLSNRATGGPADAVIAVRLFNEVMAAAEDGRLQFPGSPPRPAPAQPPSPQPTSEPPPAARPEPGGRDIDRRPPRPVEPIEPPAPPEPVEPRPLDVEPIEPRALDVEPIEPDGSDDPSDGEAGEDGVSPILLNLRQRQTARKGRKSQKKRAGKKSPGESVGKGYASRKGAAKKPEGRKKRR